MRPLDVAIAPSLNWLRVFLISPLAVLIAVGHLSGRLVAAIGSGDFVQRLLSTVGKILGPAALLVAGSGWPRELASGL